MDTADDHCRVGEGSLIVKVCKGCGVRGEFSGFLRPCPACRGAS